jgi:hypothetical protein
MGRGQAGRGLQDRLDGEAQLADGVEAGLPPERRHRPAGPVDAELDGALARATQAEAKADSLAKRVAQLEQKLAGLNSHDEVRLPAEGPEDGEGQEDGDEHKSHWWSRH